MSIPAISHGPQMISRLASQYVDKTKFRAFLNDMAVVPDNLEAAFAAIGMSLDPTAAEGQQLDICGSLVGVSRTLPNGDVLADAKYRVLVMVKIARNSCKGTAPELLAALRYIFSNPDIELDDSGGMAMHAQINRSLTSDEKSAVAIASGDSLTPGGILPRPSGVRLVLSERSSVNFFCFSDVSAPGTPLIAGGIGFSDIATPTGTWAGVITI